MIRSTLRDERGFSAVETAITIPVVLTLLLILIASGRMAKANLSVDAAAYSAARAASISRTSGEASGNASAAATQSMEQQGLTCSSTSVQVDDSAFSTAPGTRASIQVTVTCQVPLGDLSVPGMPGSRTVTGTASSALDSYRGRS